MSPKSILITGCSSGIGYDAAHTLKQRGWQVFASCRKPEDCARLQAEGLISPLLDYEDESTIQSALAQVLETTDGTLDALYNNGAYGIPGLVEDLPRDALRAIFEANFFGPFDLIRQVIPVMRAQGHGRIVNCSSVLGFVAYPWRGAYIGTKYALEGMTDTLRHELRAEPIHISLIEPGLIATKFGANSSINFKRWVDWQASARADDYRDTLLKKVDGDRNNKLEVPASDVTLKLIHALESHRPRPRYIITKLGVASNILRRALPTRATDWVVARL